MKDSIPKTKTLYTWRFLNDSSIFLYYLYYHLIRCSFIHAWKADILVNIKCVTENNSRLDDESYPLPGFPQLTEHKFCDISVSTEEISRLLWLYETIGTDKIPVFVLKKLDSNVFHLAESV